ncbi:MAG: hypothetical protein H0U70_09580 [Tatlockia sp.]|nr:hypothetical protein [Tatlockia sp.]
MNKLLIFSICNCLSIGAIYAASSPDINATKWICTTNAQQTSTNQTTGPATETMIRKTKEATQDKDLNSAFATNSLSNAFALAIKECHDCSEISCKKQK